ncbi:hypothetical protein [Halobacillus aidingensis]|uniref:Uncharacterized protein n=1 Tax=Halobacillus aidingensis TaxID=240303 RepID=A0A1H0FXF8_HALAD|nr:hypothetical protein [Halobacillus aidingensis]SDN99303.1 hypothetical protein SAMN05421677_102150 [Halobacillus aidingensis]
MILGVIGGIVSLRLTSALGKDAEEVHNEQAISGEEVRSIDIDTSTADVQIIKGANNQIKVELFGSNLDLEKYLYKFQVADGVLGIELNKKGILGFSLDFSTKIKCGGIHFELKERACLSVESFLAGTK